MPKQFTTALMEGTKKKENNVKMEGWDWKGFKCNGNKKQGGSGQWPMGNRGSLYWKLKYTTECSAL
jgi:hypothetical protein